LILLVIEKLALVPHRSKVSLIGSLDYVHASTPLGVEVRPHGLIAFQGGKIHFAT
jgi:hypothetical protein